MDVCRLKTGCALIPRMELRQSPKFSPDLSSASSVVNGLPVETSELFLIRIFIHYKNEESIRGQLETIETSAAYIAVKVKCNTN